jgi:hypothetical protein
MATNYNKTREDKLKLGVAKATYEYGIENDSCESEMVSFIASATGVTRPTAQKLFDQVKENASVLHTLTITFKAPEQAALAAQTYVEFDDFCCLLSSNTYSYMEDVPVLDGSVKIKLEKGK